MTTLLHLATSLDAITAWFTTMSVALADVLSVSALLIALNFISNLIKNTYRAGYFVGRIYWTYIVPAVLAVADFISWVNSFIDWEQVASDLYAYSKIITATLIAAFTCTYQLPTKAHLVQFTIITAQGLGTVAMATAQTAYDYLLHLVTITEPVDYSVFTVKELRTIAKQRGITGYGKMRKAQLIAAL